jgi:hypothetical protein
MCASGSDYGSEKAEVRMHRRDASLAELDAAAIVAASRGAEILVRPTVQALQAADVTERPKDDPQPTGLSEAPTDPARVSSARVRG